MKIEGSFDLILDPTELHPIPNVGIVLPIELPRPVPRQKSRNEIDPSTWAVLKALGYIR